MFGGGEASDLEKNGAVLIAWGLFNGPGCLPEEPLQFRDRKQRFMQRAAWPQQAPLDQSVQRRRADVQHGRSFTTAMGQFLDWLAVGRLFVFQYIHVLSVRCTRIPVCAHARKHRTKEAALGYLFGEQKTSIMLWVCAGKMAPSFGPDKFLETISEWQLQRDGLRQWCPVAAQSVRDRREVVSFSSHRGQF